MSTRGLTRPTADVELDGASSIFKTLGAVALGIMIGLAYYYALVLAASTALPFGGHLSPLVLLTLAIVLLLGFLLTWRWPTVGVTASATVLVIVIFAVLNKISPNPGAPVALDISNILAFSTRTIFPTLLASGMLIVAVGRIWVLCVKRGQRT